MSVELKVKLVNWDSFSPPSETWKWYSPEEPTVMISGGYNLDRIQNPEFRRVIYAVLHGETGLPGLIRSGPTSSCIAKECVTFTFGFYRIGYSAEHNLYWIMNVATKIREYIYRDIDILDRTQGDESGDDVIPPPRILSETEIRAIPVV